MKNYDNLFLPSENLEESKKLKIKGVQFLSEPFKIRTGWAVEFTHPTVNQLGFSDYIKE